MALVSNQTGIIIIPPYRGLEQNYVSMSYEELNAKILFFLCYFQNVSVIPLNIKVLAGAFLTSSELEQILVQQQVIREFSPPRISVEGYLNLQSMSYLMNKMYDLINNNSQIPYAISPSDGMENEFNQDIINSLTLIMRDILPCPRLDVPINEIIQFRQENREILDNLYYVINNTLASVANTFSLADSIEMAKIKINHSLKDIVHSFAKNKIPFFNIDMKISYAIPASIFRLGLEAVCVTYGLSPGVATLITEAISVNLSGSALKKSTNKFPADYQYVVSGIKRGYLSAFPERKDFFLNLNRIVIKDSSLPSGYPREILSFGNMSDISISDCSF